MTAGNTMTKLSTLHSCCVYIAANDVFKPLFLLFPVLLFLLLLPAFSALH